MSETKQHKTCNIEEIKFLLRAVRKHTQTFDMKEFCASFSYHGEKYDFSGKPMTKREFFIGYLNLLEVPSNSCGTTVCAAGSYRLEKNSFMFIVDIAKMCGLEDTDLFFDVAWPEDYRNKYHLAKTQVDRVKVFEDLIKDWYGVTI